MVSKVVFIGYQPITAKVKKDFYFQNLIENNIQISYWDLTEIYFKNVIFNTQLTDDCVIEIDSLDKFKNLLIKQDIISTIFITNITLEYRVLKLYKILSYYECRTLFFARGALPNGINKKNVNFFVLKLKKVVSFNSGLNFLGNKYTLLLKKAQIIRHFSIVFRAGKFGLKTIGIGCEIEENKSQIIDVNSFDFDDFVHKNNCARILDSNYCLYLDEYLPFHPDFQMFNIKTIDHENFYKALNSFFYFIEKKYNIEVVIAAHPKAEKYKSKDFFRGRRVYFNRTAELCRYADFVIGHNSTSISFAVLNIKPIILLYNESIKKLMPDFYQLIVNYSNILGVNCFDFEEEDSDIKIYNPDKFKYLDFKYKYLTSKESESRLSSEIFIQTILSI